MSDDGMNLDDGGEVIVRRRGRGFRNQGPGAKADEVTYDRLDAGREDTGSGSAARSVEGWIVLVTNVHEEATEEDIQDKFADYGDIKNLHLNLDRRTGYVKGYALVEYETYREAKNAIDKLNNTPLLEQNLECDFAFVRPPPSGPRGGGAGARGGGAGRGGRGAGGRDRSRSPGR